MSITAQVPAVEAPAVKGLAVKAPAAKAPAMNALAVLYAAALGNSYRDAAPETALVVSAPSGTVPMSTRWRCRTLDNLLAVVPSRVPTIWC